MRDGGLAGLAVADDELALTAADRDQRVERLDAGLQRLVHALALHDAGRLDLQAARLGGVDRALAVDRLAERVHHAAEQRLAHRHRGDLPGALDGVALADVAEVAHDGDADVVLLEVEHEALHAVRELDQLAGEDALEAVDAGDAVAHGEHGSGLGDGDLLAVVLDLLADDSADFVGADFHGLVCRAGGASGTRAGGLSRAPAPGVNVARVSEPEGARGLYHRCATLATAEDTGSTRRAATRSVAVLAASTR